VRIRRRFVPVAGGAGGCKLRLSELERAIIRTLPVELAEVLARLGDVDPPSGGAEDSLATPESMKRLLPPGYTTDDAAQAEYSARTRASLLEHHRRALDLLVETADADRLTQDQMHGWLAAMNDLRLVLGSVLGVSEETQFDWANLNSQEVMYLVLGEMQEELVRVLFNSLPPPIPGADDSVPDDPWGEPIGGLRWDGTEQPERKP
jgi:prophage DNA circulation protein